MLIKILKVRPQSNVQECLRLLKGRIPRVHVLSVSTLRAIALKVPSVISARGLLMLTKFQFFPYMIREFPSISSRMALLTALVASIASPPGFVQQIDFVLLTTITPRTKVVSLLHPIISFCFCFTALLLPSPFVLKCVPIYSFIQIYVFTRAVQASAWMNKKLAFLSSRFGDASYVSNKGGGIGC